MGASRESGDSPQNQDRLIELAALVLLDRHGASALEQARRYEARLNTDFARAVVCMIKQILDGQKQLGFALAMFTPGLLAMSLGI